MRQLRSAEGFGADRLAADVQRLGAFHALQSLNQRAEVADGDQHAAAGSAGIFGPKFDTQRWPISAQLQNEGRPFEKLQFV
jgi:hypothetical protein